MLHKNVDLIQIRGLVNISKLGLYFWQATDDFVYFLIPYHYTLGTSFLYKGNVIQAIKSEKVLFYSWSSKDRSTHQCYGGQNY